MPILSPFGVPSDSLTISVLGGLYFKDKFSGDLTPKSTFKPKKENEKKTFKRKGIH